MSHSSRVYTLLGLLQSYAPNGSAQSACADLYHSAHTAGATPKEIELTLVGAINDGLRYGNWPWNMKTEKA